MVKRKREAEPIPDGDWGLWLPILNVFESEEITELLNTQLGGKREFELIQGHWRFNVSSRPGVRSGWRDSFKEDFQEISALCCLYSLYFQVENFMKGSGSLKPLIKIAPKSQRDPKRRGFYEEVNYAALLDAVNFVVQLPKFWDCVKTVLYRGNLKKYKAFKVGFDSSFKYLKDSYR